MYSYYVNIIVVHYHMTFWGMIFLIRYFELIIETFFFLKKKKENIPRIILGHK
jgi:hypothetical protein